jgi:hypothetical protein
MCAAGNLLYSVSFNVQDLFEQGRGADVAEEAAAAAAAS